MFGCLPYQQNETETVSSKENQGNKPSTAKNLRHVFELSSISVILYFRNFLDNFINISGTSLEFRCL